MEQISQNQQLESNKKVDQWPNEIDPSSLSNIGQVEIQNYDITIKIDFNQEQLSGKVNCLCKSKVDNLKVVQMDVSMLQIKQVTLLPSKQPLNFEIKKFEFLTTYIGNQLEISLGEKNIKNKGDSFTLLIEYETMIQQQYEVSFHFENLPPEAQQLAFNPQDQNNQSMDQIMQKSIANKYMFTESEPIKSRTLFPCIDSPSNKSTYEIKLIVPYPLTGWSSGKLVSSKIDTEQKQWNESVFEIKKPTSCYLVAFAAGNFVLEKLSQRTAIVGPPPIVEKYKDFMSDMEKYMEEFEKLLGPYEWDEYKALLLPVFPGSAMENVMLTFVDYHCIRLQEPKVANISVIFHEMAHSWSGNLVTCKNWNNIWLNEGLTVFLQGTMLNKLLNRHYSVTSSINYNSEQYFSKPQYTALYPDIQHDDPYTLFNEYFGISYQKGASFFYFLQAKFADDELFFQFLREYFQTYKYSNADYLDFYALLEKFVLQKFGQDKGKKLLEVIKFDQWIHGTTHAIQFNEQYIPDVFELIQTDYFKFQEMIEKGFFNLSSQLALYQLVKLIFKKNWPEKMETIQLLDDLLEISKNLKLKDEDAQIVWIAIKIQIKDGLALKDIVSKYVALPNEHIIYIYNALIQVGRKNEAAEFFQNYSKGYSQELTNSIAKILEMNQLVQ